MNARLDVSDVVRVDDMVVKGRDGLVGVEEHLTVCRRSAMLRNKRVVLRHDSSRSWRLCFSSSERGGLLTALAKPG